MSFQFSAGRYKLAVYARLLGDSKPSLLYAQTLDVTPDVAAALQEPDAGLYFDWGADSSRYLPHVNKRPPSPDPEKLLEELGITMRSRGDVAKATRS